MLDFGESVVYVFSTHGPLRLKGAMVSGSNAFGSASAGPFLFALALSPAHTVGAKARIVAGGPVSRHPKGAASVPGHPAVQGSNHELAAQVSGPTTIFVKLASRRKP